MIINGEEYPFWFAIKAQKELAGADITEKDDIYFLWLGFKYGSLKDKKEFKLTEDDILDHFDSDLDAYQEACDLLKDQMGKLKSLRGAFT